MSALDEAREAVVAQTREFEALRQLVNNSPVIGPGVHQLDITTTLAQVVQLAAKTHRSVLKLLEALEEVRS